MPALSTGKNAYQRPCEWCPFNARAKQVVFDRAQAADGGIVELMTPRLHRRTTPRRTSCGENRQPPSTRQAISVSSLTVWPPPSSRGFSHTGPYRPRRGLSLFGIRLETRSRKRDDGPAQARKRDCRARPATPRPRGRRMATGRFDMRCFLDRSMSTTNENSASH